MNTQENNNSEPEEYNGSEPETYLQKEINYNQAKINFVLNEVDKDFVEALKMIVQILKKVKTLPPLMHELKGIDFAKIDAAINDADKRSKIVADIRPPGCEPYPN